MIKFWLAKYAVEFVLYVAACVFIILFISLASKGDRKSRNTRGNPGAFCYEADASKAFCPGGDILISVP